MKAQARVSRPKSGRPGTGPDPNRRLASAWASAKASWPAAMLVGTMAVVRYFRSAGFGLYEDDLTHIPIAAQMSLSELARSIFVHVSHFYGQGHPLHQPLIYLFSNLGWRLGDLHGAYWIGFALIAINVVLFYLLMERLHGRALGVLAGLAYVVFSADTTQAYLTYSFGLQPSLTLLLMALHLYVRGRRVLPYALIFLAILTYETSFAVFAAAPFLLASWDRPWRRQMAVHSIVMVGLLAVDIGLRLALSEDRVGNLTASESLLVPITHMIEGPPVALATYLYRPLQVLQSMDPGALIASAVAWGGFSLVLLRLPTRYLKNWKPRLEGFARASRADREAWRQWWTSLPEAARSLVRLATAGVLMLVLAYPFTFTVRAYAISGRDTRVHAAAVVGAAVFLGALMLLVIGFAERSGVRRGVSILLAGWLGLVAGYGFVIQRDYVRAWELQQGFWTRLVRLLPDVESGTVILVDPEGLEDTRQIGANYWNLPRVLEQLYAFPDDWEAPPRVYRLEPGWEDHIRSESGQLRLDAQTTFSPPSTLGTFDPANAILILTTGGDLSRISGPLPIAGGSISFRPAPGGGEPPYPRAFLAHYLILDETTVAVGRASPNPIRTHPWELVPRDPDPQ